MAEKFEPPPHITPDSVLWWKRVVEDFTIDAAAYPMLVMFFESRDRREEARLKIIETGGAVMKDRFGVLKANPWAAVERDAALIMTRAFKSLGFDQAPSAQGMLF